MKTLSRILFAAALMAGAAFAASCSKYDVEVDYQNPIRISFDGVDESNIVYLEKGTLSYSLKVMVESESGLMSFQCDRINPRTGATIGSPLATKDLDGVVRACEYNYDFSGLTANEGIRITVTDINSTVAAKNFVVVPYANVDISEKAIVETADVYYGIYYAHWYSGRVYIREHESIAKYKDSIDLTFGEVEGKPCVISPAARKDVYNLINLEGLHATKVALTALTAAQFNAITKVDASPIESIADPVDDKAELKSSGVYVFLRDDGTKGLLYIASMSSKTATLEAVDGTWAEGPYHQMSIITKTIVK